MQDSGERNHPRDPNDPNHPSDANHPNPANQTSDGPPGRKLRLDQFLKFMQLVGTGGEAKFRIQSGEVRVNGVVETRRGRGLRPGDQVELAGEMRVVETDLWDR